MLPSTPETDRLITLAEAKAILACGNTRIYHLLGQGRISAVKSGRRTLIPLSSIQAFVAALPPAVITTGRVAAA